MKRLTLVAGLLLSLGAAPAAAQTRVSLELGFRLPLPYVSGYVVVGRPYHHHHYYHPRPALVIVERPCYHYHRPRVVVVPRRHVHRHHHHHHHHHHH